jgi:protein SPT2
MALLREEEEEMMPHKRKRKTKEEKMKERESADKSQSQSDCAETKECEEEKPEKAVKPRRPPQPPPIDFHQLLKIAEKKQFEPIKIAPKLKEEDEDERPMTKKQRVEYMKEKEWRMRKEGKLPPLIASKQVSNKVQRNSQSQPSEERNRDRKSSHHAAGSSIDQRNNRPSVDGNRDQRNSQSSVDGQREQMSSQYSGYSKKDEMTGRFSDQRIGRPHGDVSRDQRNSWPLEENKDQKSNHHSSERGNLSIPRIPKVNSSSRIEKDEKSQHRIPKCNGNCSIGSSNNKSVKLQGNSDSKVGKERSRNEVRNINTSGKPCVQNNHTSSASASGQGSANRNSVEQRNSNNSGNSKSYNLSSYSKKLQESLLAKLQEKERSSGLSEANKFHVPETSASKFPKSHVSGSFDMTRGSKLARSSDSKDMMKKESSLGKNSAKPIVSSQRSAAPHGTLSLKSKESSLKSKSCHEIPSKDVKDRKSTQMPSKDVKHRQFPHPEVKPRQFPPADVKPRQFLPADVKPRQFTPADVKTRQFPPADVKPREFPPADVKPRQFPPEDVKPRQFPPADVKPRQFPPADVRKKQKPPPKREYILLI